MLSFIGFAQESGTHFTVGLANVTSTSNTLEFDIMLTIDGTGDAADGQKRYNDVYNDGKGWEPILFEIKNDQNLLYVRLFCTVLTFAYYFIYFDKTKLFIFIVLRMFNRVLCSNI